jgi:hypothetical protein
VRNRLQYLRLYDDNGNFRPEVGARAMTGGNPDVRKRRVTGGGEE